MKKLWEALKGHKTVIGLALQHYAPMIPEPHVATILQALGELLIGVGVASKAVTIAGGK